MNHLRGISSIYILIVCILLLSSGSMAQRTVDADEGLFSFAYNPYGATTTDGSIAPSKYENAAKVFHHLVEAKGVKNMAPPKFIMSNAEQRPAWAKPSEAIIALEEKAYDLCITMGKDSLNAIASLLSHELIHYYEKHDWRDRFKRNSEIEIDSHLDNSIELELEADHLGGLLAHMAGYNTLGVLPKLLPELYRSYDLSGLETSGYPSLADRQKVARESDVYLTKHSRIFDMSVYLTATGSYDLARTHLEYLLVHVQFQSREIYNNLGVLSLLSAIDMMPSTEVKYRYPIELETASRLSVRSAESEEITALLSEAERYLKNASILDDSYGPAQLNLAMMYALRGDLMDAEYHARRARERYEADEALNSSHLNVVEGIISAKKGQIEAAKNAFIRSDSELGRMNLCILNDRSDCYNTAVDRSIVERITVDEVNLNQLYARIMRDQEQALLSIDLNYALSFHTIAKSESEVLVSLDNQNIGSYEFFQVIKSAVPRLRQSIGVGSTIEKLEEELGSPTSRLMGSTTDLWVYRSKGLLFSIDEHGLIAEWCIYKSNGS